MRIEIGDPISDLQNLEERGIGEKLNRRKRTLSREMKRTEREEDLRTNKILPSV